MLVRRSLAAIPLALALVAIGCGGDSDESGDPPATNSGGAILNAPQYSAQDVIDAARLSTNDSGLSYTSPEGCQVAVILDSANAVNTYASAGDTVVTNPSGTAGVKVVGSTPECLQSLAEDLQALDG